MQSSSEIIDKTDFKGAIAAIASISSVGIALGLSSPLLAIILDNRGYSATVIGANAATAGIGRDGDGTSANERSPRTEKRAIPQEWRRGKNGTERRGMIQRRRRQRRQRRCRVALVNQRVPQPAYRNVASAINIQRETAAMACSAEISFPSCHRPTGRERMRRTGQMADARVGSAVETAKEAVERRAKRGKRSFWTFCRRSTVDAITYLARL